MFNLFLLTRILLTFPQPEADFQIKSKNLTFPLLESFFASSPGNAKCFCSSATKNKSFGAKSSQRGPERVSQQFFLAGVPCDSRKKFSKNCWKIGPFSEMFIFTEKTLFFSNFPPNKGLTEFLFLRGLLVKKALFWDFVHKRLLFTSIFGRNARIVFCLFFGGEGGGPSFLLLHCVPLHKHELS